MVLKVFTRYVFVALTFEIEPWKKQLFWVDWGEDIHLHRVPSDVGQSVRSVVSLASFKGGNMEGWVKHSVPLSSELCSVKKS